MMPIKDIVNRLKYLADVARRFKAQSLVKTINRELRSEVGSEAHMSDLMTDMTHKVISFIPDKNADVILRLLNNSLDVNDGRSCKANHDRYLADTIFCIKGLKQHHKDYIRNTLLDKFVPGSYIRILDSIYRNNLLEFIPDIISLIEKNGLGGSLNSALVYMRQMGDIALRMSYISGHNYGINHSLFRNILCNHYPIKNQRPYGHANALIVNFDIVGEECFLDIVGEMADVGIVNAIEELLGPLFVEKYYYRLKDNDLFSIETELRMLKILSREYPIHYKKDFIEIIESCLYVSQE